MKVQKVNIKNFKGIESLEQEINGGNVYAVGGNGVGKSSFIEAIWVGLTGKNMPPEPTHKGAKKGLIEVDLGDFIARTKLTRGKPVRFELENKNAEKEGDKFIKGPRTFLENKIGVIDFDINDFFNKSEKEQVKYFGKMMDIDLSGFDADIAEIMESRRFDKRELSKLQDEFSFFDKELAEQNIVDVVDISKRIENEKEKVRDYRDAADAAVEVDKEIEKLKAEIKELEKKGEAITEWINESPDLMSEDGIQAMIDTRDNANELNEKISEAKKAKLTQENIEAIESKIDKSSEDLEKVRTNKTEAISKAIDIKGLEYDVKGERFLFEGLPFNENQINTSAQLIAGMKIASMMLKDLKIVKMDASLIDMEQWDKVVQWSEEHDIELFVELVDREGAKLEIVVE